MNDIEMDALFERTEMDVYEDDETDMGPVFCDDSGNGLAAVGLR